MLVGSVRRSIRLRWSTGSSLVHTWRAKEAGILRVEEHDKNSSGYDGEVLEGPLVHSVESIQGRRMHMEDRFDAYSPSLAESDFSIFGVFDGHAGHECAEYLSECLVKELAAKAEERFSDNLEQTVEDLFMNVDNQFCTLAKANRWPGGSTALVAIVERDEVSGRASNAWIANTGDSRAIIVRKSGKVKEMNREHSPMLDDERQRVEAEGGYVKYVPNHFGGNGLVRVNSVLAMTRAFGNVSLKPFVTARPEITHRKLRKDDMYLCLASDGLWETVRNEDAAEYLLKYGARVGTERLVRLAYNRGSSDNITVLSVRLNMSNDHLPV